MSQNTDPAAATVTLTRLVESGYSLLSEPIPAIELPGGTIVNTAQKATRDLLRLWCGPSTTDGTPDWNPLGGLIQAGSRIVIKPNWVLHENQSGAGLECLVTHPDVLCAVLDYVLLTRPAGVIVGDAPVQSCDLPRLLADLRLDTRLEEYARRGDPVAWRDFRRTILAREKREHCAPAERYVLFDLGRESLLEPITTGQERFRVTMYDPDLLAQRHAPGRHQYLIAAELLEADVVVNLPKLKTHKKAGVTGALKNLVGINGNKEFLPHHRRGGGARGGDCYVGGSWWKERAEDLLDAANRRAVGGAQARLSRAAEVLTSLGLWMGAEDQDLEGSWFGNDTVWRMCLDLQRILRYGTARGTIESRPQRQVLSITDAIVAGEGEGPLANVPAPAGFLTAAANPAAAEWVHCHLMGFNPELIPLVRESFGAFSYPIANFPPSSITIRTSDGTVVTPDMLTPALGRPFTAPSGWLGHCEMTPAGTLR